MSNCRLFLVMLILNWSWIAFGSEQQCGKPVLVMDVYSVTVSSNDAQQHGFAFWTNELKKGPTSQKADSKLTVSTSGFGGSTRCSGGAFSYDPTAPWPIFTSSCRSASTGR